MKATSDVVAKAWVLRALGWSSGAGRTVPEAATPTGRPDWVDDPGGFVKITVMPGEVDADRGRRYAPVVSLQCFAASASSSRPPWWKANDIAWTLLRATEDDETTKAPLTLPADYEPAFVHVVNPVAGSPRELPNDISGYAVVGIDLQIVWSDA